MDHILTPLGDLVKLVIIIDENVRNNVERHIFEFAELLLIIGKLLGKLLADSHNVGALGNGNSGRGGSGIVLRTFLAHILPAHIGDLTFLKLT